MRRNQWLTYCIALSIFLLTIGGMLMGLLYLLVGRLDRLRLLTQWWSSQILKLMGVRFEIVNPNQARQRNVIYIANHTSLLDTFTYLSFLPPDCMYVSRVELEKLGPVTWFGRKMGHIFLDRKNPYEAVRMVIDMAKSRTAGEPLFIHPEGTRNTSGDGILPFKSGIYLLVKHTGCDVIPIVSSKGEKLWPKGKLLSEAGSTTIRFGDTIPYQKISEMNKSELGIYLREKMLELL